MGKEREYFMKLWSCTVTSIFAILANCSVAISEEFKTINTREDVTISFIENTPVTEIKAAAMLFAGGDGIIDVDVKNKTVGSSNFLVRSRGLFAKFGVLTITPDVPSDMDGGIKNDRGNSDYRADINFLIKEIQKATDKPIWLIGTSRGSITVSYHAAALNVQGIVLTATVTTGNHDTVFGGDLEGIKVPALVVHHENDQCWVSPAHGTKEIIQALSSAPKKQTLIFQKGKAGDSEDCGPISPHGFLGIENQVVSEITNWMFKSVK